MNLKKNYNVIISFSNKYVMYVLTQISFATSRSSSMADSLRQGSPININYN
jgi:hypothetical protein